MRVGIGLGGRGRRGCGGGRGGGGCRFCCRGVGKVGTGRAWLRMVVKRPLSWLEGGHRGRLRAGEGSLWGRWGDALLGGCKWCKH